MTLPRTLDVAIVGAGPAGIGTAVALESLEIEYAVLERDCIGSSFRQWPDEMRLLTPSFPATAFGTRDLNAVTPDTSPALALDREHPTGEQYADYLEAVAAFHEVPVYGDVDVDRVVPGDGTDTESGETDVEADGFTLETSAGPLEADYVVWAAGEYQYPADGSFPGAEHAVHVSTVDSWATYADRWSPDGAETAFDRESSDSDAAPSARVAADGAGAIGPATDDVVIVGGAESGIDAALGLADAGCSVAVLDADGPWQYRSPDPSEVLSPRTSERLERALTEGRPIDLVTDARVASIECVQAGPVRADDGYVLRTTDGDRFRSRAPPLLATGFEGSLAVVDDPFAFDGDAPALTDRDESTETPGLFLVGPQVAHDGQQFCFIYKFRQRFAVVAETIADRLGVDTDPLEAYRERGMFLDDLECCEPEYCDC
ncbi:NAD(P)-binding domain-containing protein [Haloterrigena sp. SYSU A558-1]|uniref:NAD(P)-binding domain-containing protein n=1 Tax=Haloterrigena gelatinilytica TaxID=2741724 RepID=A0A8J8GIS1_9EURY|nr:NAD(P)/FAD-dependent oxidoreductase [Haloterrigena gelatinilytica]NUB90784.1 NAD(P)-binding domain-containing protein [Haloterrigena gelatinilytica]NUC73399.1 NAD(P)-binding domain-containing protein [Haloterrigena gelatinilytica]